MLIYRREFSILNLYSIQITYTVLFWCIYFYKYKFIINFIDILLWLQEEKQLNAHEIPDL